MKKLILSFALIISFTFYALLRDTGGQSPAVFIPSSGGKGIKIPDSIKPPDSGVRSNVNSILPGSQTTASHYKDGTYVGAAADAYYGNVQVQAVIRGGQISDVAFLDYPRDRSNSIRINAQAMPYLKQEAIQAQSARVDGVSGATQTSQAFIESLSSALDQASN